MGVAIVARTLRVDVATAEVVRALQHARIEPVLLKGPVLADRLYDPGEARDYTDADLLVDPSFHAEAEAILQRLGFVKDTRWEGGRRLAHASEWSRKDGTKMDLHRALPGVRNLEPHTAWRRLLPHAVGERVLPGGVLVRTLDDPGCALTVALHVTHHSPHPDLQEPARDDLDRAVRRLPLETWRAAASLAEALEATLDLAHALAKTTDGAVLAASLALPPPSSGEQAPAGLERVLAARGPRARLRIMLRALVPTPAHLRWVSPLARRGRLGLAAAYLQRPLWLLKTARPALAARRRQTTGG